MNIHSLVSHKKAFLALAAGVIIFTSAIIWTTYVNTDLGFSLNFPSEWGSPENNLLSTSERINFGSRFSVSKGVYYNQIEKRHSTLQEITAHIEGRVDGEKEDIILDEAPAIKLSYTVPKGASGFSEGLPFPEKDLRVIEIYAQRQSDEEIYLIYYEFYLEEENEDHILNEIVESFRFVEQKNPIVLLLVEDSLLDGLADALNIYSEDIKKEFGFTGVTQAFSASANVLDIKNYIQIMHGRYNIEGVLLIGNLATGKFYDPRNPPVIIPFPGFEYADFERLYDFIYQDIDDVCPYSEEFDAFDFTTPGCVRGDEIERFWVSRLTPNSSSQSDLSLLQDYFKRNHAYRTKQYAYEQKILWYHPHPPLFPLTEEEKIARDKELLEIFNMYDEENYNIIGAARDDSDSVYLRELKKSYEYEILRVCGHGGPFEHMKDIGLDDVSGAGFLFGSFTSCSIGRFVLQDYIAGKYLFEGEGLIVTAAPGLLYAGCEYRTNLYYPLAIGEPFFEALKIGGFTNHNYFGDLTLRMRYADKPMVYELNSPKIKIDKEKLIFTPTQPKASLKIKNLGISPLEFKIDHAFYIDEKVAPLRGAIFAKLVYFEQNSPRELAINPRTIDAFEEEIFNFEFRDSDALTSGIYKGEVFILSTDPVNPYIIVPFEIHNF